MRGKGLAVYFGLVLFLIASFLIRLNLAEKPKIIPRNGDVTLLATIEIQPRISERSQIIAIGNSRLFVSLYPKYLVGDRLKVEGFVDEQGRIFNAKVEKVQGVQKGQMVQRFLARLRLRIATNIDKLLPSSEATLVKGMVLGVEEIGRDLRQVLIATGTIHVVVVSGQNLSIVAGIFVGLARYIGKRQSLALATLAVFAYALLTGFEPPVVRASLMVLAGTLAVFLGRQSWPILNLILAALLILFIWPKALFEISFQLTFAATLGIMTLGSAVQNWTRKKLRNHSILVDSALQNAAVATSAYLFTTPIIWWHFERISLIAPLANTLVAELVAPMMILGFLVAGASLIWLPVAQVLAYLAYVPAFVFMRVVEVFSNF